MAAALESEEADADAEDVPDVCLDELDVVLTRSAFAGERRGGGGSELRTF